MDLDYSTLDTRARHILASFTPEHLTVVQLFFAAVMVTYHKPDENGKAVVDWDELTKLLGAASPQLHMTMKTGARGVLEGAAAMLDFLLAFRDGLYALALQKAEVANAFELGRKFGEAASKNSQALNQMATTGTNTWN